MAIFNSKLLVYQRVQQKMPRIWGIFQGSAAGGENLPGKAGRRALKIALHGIGPRIGTGTFLDDSPQRNHRYFREIWDSQ